MLRAHLPSATSGAIMRPSAAQHDLPHHIPHERGAERAGRPRPALPRNMAWARIATLALSLAWHPLPCGPLRRTRRLRAAAAAAYRAPGSRARGDRASGRLPRGRRIVHDSRRYLKKFSATSAWPATCPLACADQGALTAHRDLAERRLRSRIGLFGEVTRSPGTCRRAQVGADLTGRKSAGGQSSRQAAAPTCANEDGAAGTGKSTVGQRAAAAPSSTKCPEADPCEEPAWDRARDEVRFHVALPRPASSPARWPASTVPLASRRSARRWRRQRPTSGAGLL